ncbi:hypothetical protein TGAM01_v200750 [Trichoderma gamsii]|uniref:Uncharacterized protein n=1 Tax=Trichoderma gamsii TaxID=398673 RepID=A0A2P5A192_9HYPO|nr:hypothetical protein TGAM01_v200750 [Trichoderma gamsii]PON30310.1 hypothetical protein TGAM01_v200750 [Trichoderma gamsii]
MWQRHRANLGFAGKGGPWSPGKEIEGPLALGARSLAAVLLAALEVLEALEDAAKSCCWVWGSPHGGSAGPEAAELRGKADAVQRRSQAMSGPWLDP